MFKIAPVQGPSERRALAKIPIFLWALAGPALEDMKAACDALRLVCQGYALTENGFCEEQWMGASLQLQQGAGLSDMLGSLLSGLLGTPQLSEPNPQSPQQVSIVPSHDGLSSNLCTAPLAARTHL